MLHKECDKGMFSDFKEQVGGHNRGGGGGGGTNGRNHAKGV